MAMDGTHSSLADLTRYSKTHPVFIMFHMPSCGHCQRAKPAFLQAARETVGTPFRFVLVDCAINMAAATQAKIDAFPTFKLYAGKRTYDYTGDRTARSFVSWLCQTGKYRAAR